METEKRLRDKWESFSDWFAQYTPGINNNTTNMMREAFDAAREEAAQPAEPPQGTREPITTKQPICFMCKLPMIKREKIGYCCMNLACSNGNIVAEIVSEKSAVERSSIPATELEESLKRLESICREAGRLFWPTTVAAEQITNPLNEEVATLRQLLAQRKVQP